MGRPSVHPCTSVNRHELVPPFGHYARCYNGHWHTISAFTSLLDHMSILYLSFCRPAKLGSMVTGRLHISINRASSPRHVVNSFVNANIFYGFLRIFEAEDLSSEGRQNITAPISIKRLFVSFLCLVVPAGKSILWSQGGTRGALFLFSATGRAAGHGLLLKCDVVVSR